jgi:hypothetical protein
MCAPPRRPARLARKAAESGGANRRGAPGGGSQKRQAARPRGAEPAASVHWSKPPWQSSNARQTISLGRVTALSTIGYNTRGRLARSACTMTTPLGVKRSASAPKAPSETTSGKARGLRQPGANRGTHLRVGSAIGDRGTGRSPMSLHRAIRVPRQWRWRKS